ncbi:MAG: hypothetical protein M1822_006279 [Bathelium mastoideum]|nr:MAG: hypothetical protein M1822_006279 [Bathelium mastoideum]
MPSLAQLPHHEAEHRMPEASAQDETKEKRIRLHVTPLNPPLLQAYLSSSLLAHATNISYHSIETFPEKTYGYIELPIMEAEKLKKKLNGSTLKGNKVRIEEAKPESKKRKIEDEANEDDERSTKSHKRSSKKKKRVEGVLPGVDLPEDRKVKRGWTESEAKRCDKEKKRKRREKEEGGKKKKKRDKSKYTNEPELLFKTKIPSTQDSVPRPKTEKKKKKGSKKDETIVHEFSKTKKLKNSDSGDAKTKNNSTSHYEEGVGWLDSEGHVIEPAPKKRKQKAVSQGRDTALALDINASTSSAGGKPSEQARPRSSGSEYLQSPGTQLRGELNQALAGVQSEEQEESAEPEDAIKQEGDVRLSEGTSGISEGSEEEFGSDEDAGSSEAPRLGRTKSPDPGNRNSSIISTAPDDPKFTTEQTLQTRPTLSTQSETLTIKEVHPLEALYKRPQSNAGSPKKPTPIQTDFTFFGGDEEGEEKDQLGALPTLPHTPFTRQDMEFRGIRSAAPTPDTAAIGKKFLFPWTNEPEDEDEEEVDEDAQMKDVAPSAGKATENDIAASKATADGVQEPKEETEFEKWFWEHRGETNRAWKKRRRESMKEKRHRENRRLNRRIV